MANGAKRAGSMIHTMFRVFTIHEQRHVSTGSMVWHARAVRAFGHGAPAALATCRALLKNGGASFE